ncbi:hypothetical protein P038_01403, partial [Brucella abortus 99-9971-135]
MWFKLFDQPYERPAASATDMFVRATFLGKLHLLLALGIARTVFRRALGIASGAGNTFLEKLRKLVLRCERTAAGAAKLHVAFGKPMPNGHA